MWKWQPSQAPKRSESSVTGKEILWLGKVIEGGKVSAVRYGNNKVEHGVDRGAAGAGEAVRMLDTERAGGTKTLFFFEGREVF